MGNEKVIKPSCHVNSCDSLVVNGLRWKGWLAFPTKIPLHVGSHESGVEWQNPLPHPAGHTAFNTAPGWLMSSLSSTNTPKWNIFSDFLKSFSVDLVYSKLWSFIWYILCGYCWVDFFSFPGMVGVLITCFMQKFYGFVFIMLHKAL